MADYQKMYHIMFNSITDVIRILQKLQQDVEELYIGSEDMSIALLPSEDGEGENDDGLVPA